MKKIRKRQESPDPNIEVQGSCVYGKLREDILGEWDRLKSALSKKKKERL